MTPIYFIATNRDAGLRVFSTLDSDRYVLDVFCRATANRRFELNFPQLCGLHSALIFAQEYQGKRAEKHNNHDIKFSCGQASPGLEIVEQDCEVELAIYAISCADIVFFRGNHRQCSMPVDDQFFQKMMRETTRILLHQKSFIDAHLAGP